MELNLLLEVIILLVATNQDVASLAFLEEAQRVEAIVNQLLSFKERVDQLILVNIQILIFIKLRKGQIQIYRKKLKNKNLGYLKAEV